ncbi:MAG: transporter substrate-binding domain-containing protein [Firmicutes bacterium]|nr:transporter substrate-binding domain-containing protein [Bacillota bacterium]MBQ2217631.1 transporter substrate-binding domain-containing protein [Bacillota bacterium]MBR3395222.1 transporter substrate-binding domain-containing protein [Bacillota bacterium]
MKKVFAILLALAMVFSMAACSSGGGDSSGDAAEPANRLEAIKARGYIEMATEPYFAPYEFIDSSKSGDEQYQGLDIELGKYIAEKLGVELRIVPLEFSAVLASITEGKYDFAASALAYSPGRAENMNMSKGYRFSDEVASYGFLVREDMIDSIKTADDTADLVLVTQSGSVQEGFVNDQISKYKDFKLVSSMTDGFLMVAEGKADACACDINNGQLYADANGGLAIAPFRFVVDESTQGTRVGIPKGEDELTAFIDQCIDELRAEGTIDKWYDEYSDYARTLGVD